MTFTFFDLANALRRKTPLRFTYNGESFVSPVSKLEVADRNGRIWRLEADNGSSFSGGGVLMWLETNAGPMTLAVA